MVRPKISIIVTTFGRAQGLQKLFDSLQATTPPDVYELVVVSSDPPETPKAAWLRQQTNRARIIFADARQSWQLRRRSNYYYINVGIRNSSYPWIFPCSDDMYVEPGWYEAFSRVINDPANAPTGLVIGSSHIGNLQSGIRVVVIGKTKKGSTDWKDLYLSDVSIVRRDIMEQIGLFDEKMDWFGSGADLSLSVEFLTDTKTIVAEDMIIPHSISRENRNKNIVSAFFDFHYIINKWNRWCKRNGCQFHWDPGIPSYTVVNRIKNYYQLKKAILRYYVKYFLRGR
ncbi:MAG: glycosyltransferase [Patescibacteria group bacterium]